MKNSEYWEKRVAEPTWNIYNNLEEKNRALLEMYQEASLSISDELYRVAEKMKTATPMLSDMHKFNRLTNLQNNINSTIKELGLNVESFGKKNMYEGFSKNYKATMEAIGQTEFSMPNKKLMEQLLNKPWLGSNFSKRLWKNTKVLARNLNDILTIGLQQGKTVTEMAIQLNNRMNKGFNAAHKLVRTETMHYLNVSNFKAYQDVGCEEVQVWAAVDERTCPTCGLRHGNIYRMSDKPALPFHANCRCTYLPVVNEVTKISAPVNIDGEEIKFNLNDMKVEKQDEIKETITELAKQYNTRLKSVSKGRDSNGTKGFVGMDFNMTLATSLKNTVVHEFAHSLSSTKTEKLKLTDDKDFWKEIKKVRTKYNKAIRENISKKISSYADENIDEFMAEAFTHSYLKNTKYLGWEYGSDYEYSDMVLKIINKYFKKVK